MRFLNQTEQAGGWWLTSVELDDATPLPFGFQLNIDGSDLALFRQQGSEAQFLSTSNIDIENTDSIRSNVDTPTWQIFQECLAPEPTQGPTLLLASDLNIANLLHFAQSAAPDNKFVALLEASENFPFTVKPAKFLFEDFPPEAIGACPLLEDWKIPNRLCSEKGLPGCFEGKIDTALSEWQSTTSWQERWRVIDFRILNESITNS
ncbi:hypothetical protein [Hydrogenovibrio marinus]|uniref:Uncharacterized protein n=1 Tax=Hydrogenovibrio marinus TaxID=28885 RepID=A0A067A045_HYDMR|nr:hypothetical protein [Hydrogenovibrio marinus]KDN95685.1 hypothetical protein EI16_05140 [Hydrogenovibrio marinus]BBN58835.1 hypothetical protein HVMH_0429 [Hydrogenovibrio marinus]